MQDLTIIRVVHSGVSVFRLWEIYVCYVSFSFMVDGLWTVAVDGRCGRSFDRPPTVHRQSPTVPDRPRTVPCTSALFCLPPNQLNSVQLSSNQLKPVQTSSSHFKPAQARSNSSDQFISVRAISNKLKPAQLSSIHFKQVQTSSDQPTIKALSPKSPKP